MASGNDDLSLLQDLLASSQSAVCRWDFISNELVWSKNAASILKRENMDGLSTIDEWVEAIDKDDQGRFKKLKDSLPKRGDDIDMEYNLQQQETSKLRLRQHGHVLLDDSGKPQALISTITVASETGSTKDASFGAIAEERRVNDRRGYHYPPAFMKHLKDSIEHSKSHNEQGTFMLLALTNLAMIINGYGFESSEAIIMKIKHALEKALGPHDKVERLNRDQLGIILANCDKYEALRKGAEFKNLIQNLASRTDIGPLHVTCAIGSVGFPEYASNVSEALDRAYVALNDNTHVVFRAFEDSNSNSEKSRQQMALANYLNAAIKENRLRLAYQPIIQASTGNVAHYECLLRVVDDEGKITSAGALIPIAERMGLIEIIDRLVVEKVVEELRKHPTVSLAFNISNMTTGNEDWLAYLSELLDGDVEVASRMVVEITETAAQRDLRETAYFVASVQALGCQVSLDDFGSGYTSFRQLKALSVDMLKIDGAFIRDLVDNADNRFFVKTLLDFTSGYGLEAVAEYVETGEVAKMLMELGVEFMQGFYFSQPLNYRPWLDEGEHAAD